jgi:hypothetical protein
MARKSRWQQFTDNFNGVYGAFNKIGQDIETQKLMDDKQFTAEGAAGYGLSGNALEKARYKALSNIYTKYGNAKDGLAARQQLSNLEATDRKNELEERTLDERVRQNGLLQSLLMQSQTGQNNASSANLNAKTADIEALTQGRVTAQDLANATAEQKYRLGQATFGDKVGLSAAELTAASIANEQSQFNLGLGRRTADATVAGANADARSKIAAANVAEGTSAATIAGAKIDVQTAEQKLALARELQPTQVKAAEVALAQAQQQLELAELTQPFDVQQLMANAGLAQTKAQTAKQTQDATVIQANAEASQAQTQAETAKQTQDATVSQAESEASQAEAAASLAATDADVAAQTAGGEVEATDAENAAKVWESKWAGAQAQVKAEGLSAEEQIWVDNAAGKWASEAEQEKALIDAIRRNPKIPKERQLELINTIQNIGLTELNGESAKIATSAQNALQKGGVEGLVEYYDTVDDGNTLEYVVKDGMVSVIETRGGQTRTLFEATGENAASIVEQKLITQLARPGTGLSVAAAAADLAKTQSQTALVDRQAFSEALSLNTAKAQQMLLKAQTDKINQEIKASKGGLSESKKIAQEGLAGLMRNEFYISLNESNPGLAADLVKQFMRTFKMDGAPPATVPADLWFNMTDAEKAAFAK